MKKQKKKSLQIVKRIVTLFLILAITSTQIEPSVFAASSDGQWASESLKEDAVTENESADATADSTGTSNTDESHTEESETEKKPETTENPAQNPGNADTTDGTTQDPGNADTTGGTTQDQDNADNADKTEQDPETVVTEEQPTEEPDENLSAADAVLPVEISYYLPKFQELKIEAPEEYTDEEQQEEARAAVTDQAMADETTQKLLEQADKDAESADTDESAVDTQALTESAVSEEEYVSYTQMAVTGDTLAAPAVSLPDDVQLDPEADPEDTDPLIGWQVAKLAGIVLSYADGTEINEGDVIPADQINEVSATAVDDGIALMSIDASALAQLIALTQDMTVVQRVGEAGANGKWSILVQGGTVQSDTAGTVRHAYGTIAKALEAINKDTSSNSFKITLLDDYTATTNDLSALGTSSRTGGKLGGRTTNKPTILFTGAVNYDKSTSYQSWNTLTFPDSSYVYFSGYDPYFTHINIDGRSLYIFGNQNDTSFVDMKFVSGVERLFGGQNSSNTATVNYTLTLDQIITTADAPIKNLYGGSWNSVVGDVTLKITDSEIYGNVYASGRSIGYTQTGNVTANLENVSIYRYYNKFQTDKKTADTDKDMLKAIDETGGAFFGADGKVTGDVSAYFTGNYYAQYGTWYGRNANTVSGQCNLSFNLTNKGLRFVGTYNAKVSAGNSSITVRNTTVANVFGWDYLYVYNSDVASGSNFGRMQYNSSFSHYYENASTIEYKNGKASYTPDQRGYEGIASFNSSHIYSTGQHWEGGWNRQYYKIIQLWDSGNKFELSGCDKDGSNLFRVEKYIYGVTSSYKAVILGTGVRTKAEALRYILLDSNDSSARNSVNYLTPQALTGESIYTAYYDSPYVRIYYTGTDASVTDSIRLLNPSGRVLLTGTRIAPMIEKLKTISTAGSYTICVNVPYTLNDDDLNAFNTSHNYLANKNVIMQGQGSFIAGGQLKQTTGDWAGKGPDTAATSFRFSRLYPQFKSLKWNNFVMRGDFLDNNGERPTEYYFHGNGRDLSFENCEFTGPVTIDAGGASGYNTKTQGSTVSLKNCKNVKNVYANNSSNASLGITTLMIDSCTGYEDAPVNIDVARVGTVSGLTVNVKNCKAKIASYYTNTAKITGGYTLNVTDSEVSFVNPLVTTSNMAFVYLQGDVTLTDTCKDIPSSSGGKSYLRIYGNVKTSSEKAVYLQDFNEITIDGGQLKLGDSANKIEGGLYYSYRRAAVSLKNSGKLMFAYMPSYQYYRWIDSLESDATNTELSVAYATTGYPLYVSNALTLPSSSQLRVSTSLMPTHTGTTEYPLIQFAASSNAKLNQYTWIADQRYYLAKGSNASQIVLRADIYAPMVYQRFTSWRTMTLDANGNQTGAINLYIKDYARNAIDTDGTSINKASNGKYPKGLQVYLSTQDVQKKDGVYGYVYNSSKDIQLTSYNKLTSESYMDVNSNSISATSDSPILQVQIPSRTYTAGVNYFIYVRDVAGNWSKFLLDTNGPTINYTNVTATGKSDGSFNYTFSGLQFTDAAKEVSYGTSDITDLSYTANATKYINGTKRIKYVRYNKTGVDPWTTTTGSTTVTPSSTGTYTLSNVNLKATEKLYVFAMDGYGNKSKFEFVPVTFDATSGGVTPDGKFRTGEKKTSTLIQAERYLKEVQLPADPIIGSGELAFKYWYYSTSEDKAGVNLRNVSTSVGVTFYPLWEYPTVTISNQVTGNNPDKSKDFVYKITVKSNAGSYTQGTRFECVGGTISGSGATKPTTTSLTMDRSSALTFKLKHGQTLTIKLQDYYGSFRIVQADASPYWTTYVSQNAKYDGRDTSNITVNSKNWSYAFTNSNIVSQPVVYQSKVSGTWTTGEGDAYKRGIKLYIRDIYGNGIDKTGESFSTSEKGKYPTPTKGIGHIYLSSQDVKAVDGKYNFVYNSKTDHLLENIGSGIWYTQQTFWDINQQQIPIDGEHPVLDYTMSTDNYLSMDPNTKYFIYVRDITGNWTKFLLDTKGPELHDDSKIKTTKSGSTYTCSIEEMWFSDDEINADTSILNNVEGFSYSSNATAINTRVEKVIANTTGIDPFENASAAQWTATRNSSGDKFSLRDIQMSEGQTLYVFAIDAYGNKTAVKFIPVTFDSQCGGDISAGKFTNGDQYYYTLGRLNGYLSTSQIPSNPKLNELGFKYWYKSSDSSKTAVDFKKTQITGATTFYPVWEKPTVTISTQVAGNAADKNQTFNYTVDVFNASGVSYGSGQKYNVTSGVLEGTEATAPSYNGTITADSKGKVVLTLKHGQSVTLEMPDYYGRVNVAQRQVDPYTTTYAFTDGTGQPGNTDLTSIMKVTAINRSVAYTNTAIKSQPVVYQGKWEGKWNSTDGDSYNKKTTIYIRDLYGDGIDTNGSSFTEAEKEQFNWKGLRVQAYFSMFDAPKDRDGYNLIDANANFTPLENICVHSEDVEKLTSGTITDINGKEIPVSADKPVWAISLTAGYKFDQNSNYFIYVHDQAGHWTKFLLDTKAPEMTAEGDISVSKSGDTYTCEISNMKFEDKVIEASTSALKNVEGFTYSANATKENSSIFDELRANTTGEDPFQYTSKNYWSTIKNADGTFTFSRPMNLKENQMLYIFAQDAYGNTTAIQYVPVTFDATEGGAHKKTAFDDNTTIKSMLVRKGGKLIADQIPKDPHFTVDTTQKFLNWYVSTDTTDKEKVDLTNHVANAGVTFYANYEMPGITITQEVTGDAANRNQEFTYLVKLEDADGQKLEDGTKIPYVAYAVDGSGAEPPDIGELIVTGTSGEFSFTLKHGQAVKLLPGALNYNVGYIKQTDSAGYTCAYKVVGQKAVPSTEAYDISIDEIEGQIDFINTKDIVVTGISDGLNSKTLPIVGLAATVVMLGVSALMLKRRRRS